MDVVAGLGEDGGGGGVSALPVTIMYSLDLIMFANFES